MRLSSPRSAVLRAMHAADDFVPGLPLLPQAPQGKLRFAGRFLLLATCWASALGGLLAGAAEGPDAAVEESSRPNIVLILADDLGWGSLGCYGADALLDTPHLDRLAREGRRFTDANTPSSVCSPTRYALLTGRYCWRTSLKYEVLSTTAPLHIEPTRLNIASLLHSLGYRTAVVGKWHLGYQTQPRVDFTQPLRPGPQDLGFEYQFALASNHGDVSGVYVEGDRVAGLRSSRLDPGKTRNFRGTTFLGLDAPQRVDEEVMPTLTDKVVAWLEQQTPEQPFFLYYAPVSAHNPITPSKATRGTSGAGAYGDWIHELDRSVGAVLETLDRLEVADDTLVLFTADNGGEFYGPEQAEAQAAGLDQMGPFKGDKHTVWEGGFRVPYLLRWPGHVPAGTVCDEMLSLTDTLATIAAVVGVPLPPASEAAEDSFNMLPAWLGEPTDRPLRPQMVVHSADGVFAIRQGPWKWIEGEPAKPNPPAQRRDEFRPQLYHLRRDLGETRDVQANSPEVAARLEALLDRLRDQGHSRP